MQKGKEKKKNLQHDFSLAGSDLISQDRAYLPAEAPACIIAAGLLCAQLLQGTTHTCLLVQNTPPPPATPVPPTSLPRLIFSLRCSIDKHADPWRRAKKYKNTKKKKTLTTPCSCCTSWSLPPAIFHLPRRSLLGVVTVVTLCQTEKNKFFFGFPFFIQTNKAI